MTYTSSKKGTYSNESSSYTSNDPSLKVVQYQVKESKGAVCTCQKKGPCRGTCIST